MKKIFISAGIVIAVVVVAGIGSIIALHNRQGMDIRLTSQLVNQTVPEMANNAAGIIDATVKDVLPSQLTKTDSGSPMVYTDYVIGINKTLKGSFPAEITLRLPGGSVGQDKDKVTVIAEDTPVLNAGQHIVLFLADSKTNLFDLPANHYTVYAGFTGAYEIANDQASNEKEVLPYDILMSEIQSGLSTKTN
jgi:hypothetical protein